MESEDTLKEMAPWDFRKPYSVTIVYEDSDNEVPTEDEYNYYECAMANIYNDKEVELHIPEYRESERYYQDAILHNTENNLNNKQNDEEYLSKNKKKDNIKKSNDKHIANENHCSHLDTELNSVDPKCSGVISKVESNKKSGHLNNNSKKIQVIQNTKLENFDELNTFLNGLLLKVSESLIHILDAYFMHLRNINNTNNSTFVQESKKRYVRVKNHFFQLSYCTTTTIILPRENNTKFIDDFLNYTVKVAEQKNIKITAQQIKPIYYEMIWWAKQKKDIQSVPLNALVNSTKSNLTTPLLREKLSQPQLQPCQNPLMYSHQQITYSKEICNREINNNAQHGQNQQFHLYNNVLPQPVSSERPISKLRNQRLPVPHNNYGKKLTSLQSEYTPEAFNVDGLNTNFDKNCAPPAYEKRTDVCNPMDMRFLPTYESLYQWNNQSFIPENQTVRNTDQIRHLDLLSDFVKTRSSVSTDSGFISPQLNMHSPDDMVHEEIQSAQVTPLITHVTSLNPNAPLILEGLCHVCGATTKKKCLGCYQMYYCSYNCQKHDWNTHMIICVPKSASRQCILYQNQNVQ